MKIDEISLTVGVGIICVSRQLFFILFLSVGAAQVAHVYYIRALDLNFGLKMKSFRLFIL